MEYMLPIHVLSGWVLQLIEGTLNAHIKHTHSSSSPQMQILQLLRTGNATLVREKLSFNDVLLSHYIISGRPWNDLATSVYINTTIDKSINLQGFTPWGGARPDILNTTFYAEYNSSGAYTNQGSN
jgi:hypothetical protein